VIALLYGEPGWNRWPPIRKVFGVLTSHDTVLYRQSDDLGRMLEYHVKTMPGGQRPKLDPYQPENVKYTDRRDSQYMLHTRMLAVGNPIAVVLFREGADDGATGLGQLVDATHKPIAVYEWDDFVTEMQQ
tara:strand:+ start:35 stop:424 length:390 start_codon:yes stop_codon:yes gene_type:complete